MKKINENATTKRHRNYIIILLVLIDFFTSHQFNQSLKQATTKLIVPVPKAAKPPIQAAQITCIAGHGATQAPAMIVATYLLIPRTTTIQAILAATPLL
ncbi:hypothetical protein O3Q50_00245 [Enterococcus lactis]